MTLTPEQKEDAAKAFGKSVYDRSFVVCTSWIANELIEKDVCLCFEKLQSELAKVGLVIQPLSAGFVNLKLLSACRQALKVVSEIADIDAENRAGWCHKELQEVIDEATAIQPIEKEKE